LIKYDKFFDKIKTEDDLSDFLKEEESKNLTYFASYNSQIQAIFKDITA